MRHSLCAIATLLFVITCAMSVQAQDPTKAPATESSPKSTKQVDVPPTGARQKPIVTVDPSSSQSSSVQQLLKALESAGVSKPKMSSDEEAAATDAITVALTLRAEEPFEKVKQLIEGLRGLGVTKLSLNAPPYRSEHSSAVVTADANVPFERVIRVADFLRNQKELKLLVKGPRISTATLLLVKSDWSQVPAAKEIEAEVRQLLKEISVPQEQLDRLPASAAEILFAPEVVAIYSEEHYAQLLAWLNKHALVQQTIQSEAFPYTFIRSRCDFLRLSPIPQVTSEPFVSRWADFTWRVDTETLGSNTVQVIQSLQIMEQGRGQANARPSERLDECRFTFACSTGQVAILSAFPKQVVDSALRRASREQGLEVLLVVDVGGTIGDRPSSQPQLRLPDQVDTLQQGGRGLRWPAPLKDPGRPSVKKTASPPPNDPEIRSLTLKDANAVSVAELVRQLFKEQSVSIGVDERTNAILLRGQPDILAQIEAIAQKLDQPSMGNPGEQATDSGLPNPLGTSKVDLPNSDGKSRDYRVDAYGGMRLSSGRSQATLAELQKRYEDKEQKAILTAQRLRELSAKGSAQELQVVQLRTELRAAVAAAFSVRQQLHLAELAEFQNRALQIQRTIAMRSGIQDQIIDRRVEDLLRPDLRWDSDKPSAPGQPNPTSGSPIGLPGPPRIPGQPALPSSSPATGLPLDPKAVPSNPNLGSRRNSTPLSKVVRAFNERNATYRIDKDQLPLTDDEIVASIRWFLSTRGKRNLSPEEASAFEAITESRRLPDNVELELLTDFEQPDGSKLTKWTIQLTLRGADGTSTQKVLREQLVRWQPKPGAVPEHPGIDANLANAKGNGKPLAAAIHGFNLEHQSDRIGKDQPLLTEEEVIAAIRWWKTKRNEADLTNEEFQAFQAIADTRLLPEKVEFEVLTGFQPNQEFEFDAWSVRIVMPRLSKPGWTYGFSIRERWINSRRLDDQPISWGPPAANGIQAGILFEPHNEQYTSGQQVKPSFFYRNVGSQPLSVAFPRLMTHSYYDAVHAVDNAGRDIAIDQDSGPGGPVGWIQMTLDPKSQHEIKGLPIVLGDVPREAGVETVVRAQPSQACRVRFTVSNYGEPKSQPIQTGEVLFTIADRAVLAPQNTKSQ